jgi:hypothetical protein
VHGAGDVPLESVRVVTCIHQHGAPELKIFEQALCRGRRLTLDAVPGADPRGDAAAEHPEHRTEPGAGERAGQRLAVGVPVRDGDDPGAGRDDGAGALLERVAVQREAERAGDVAGVVAGRLLGRVAPRKARAGAVAAGRS